MCKKLLIFAVMLNLVNIATATPPTGQIMREVWTGIGGTVTTDLTNNAAYPDNPTYADLVTALEAPTDFDDNFGSRIHGYLYPATSGDYTFWIASDDASDLWLSTDDDPANAALIASVSGWTSSRDFDGTTGAPGGNQMSAPVTLEAGQLYYISAIYKEGGGGDNLAVAWQGPDCPDRAVIDGYFLSPAPWAPDLLKAQNPVPADGAVDVDTASLEWTAGKATILNNVYISTDITAVEARENTTLKDITYDASSDIGPLDPLTTYYWAIDGITPTGVVAGPTWSFSTGRYVLIEDSITLDYDNTVEPYVSEAAIDAVADLTAGGEVSELMLNFQGMGPNLNIDEETGTYTITGEGADIWDSTDAFHYVYMQLTGDGEISARVLSNGTGSNTWAKGGVMIRETTAPDSKHMIMAMTGSDGGGIAFQGRGMTGGNSSSLNGDVTASPPYWVKLTRVGNDITGSYSADGETWEPMTDTSPDDSGGFGISNPQVVEMTDPVLIGLFVTSHADGEIRTYTFDNVDFQGDVKGVLISEDIASVSGNSAESVYVALEDLTGATAAVTYPNPAATQVTTKRAWTIPLSAFEGVDPTAAAKLYVGVGNGEPGGKGSVTFSDIKVDGASSASNIIWVSDGSDYNSDGAPDDMEWVDILKSAGYSVNYTEGTGLGYGYWRTLDDDKIAALNAADLIIVGRDSNSSEYANDAMEIAQWNAITTPLILSSTHIARSSRWNWVDSTSILTLAPEMNLEDGAVIQAIDENVGPSSFIDADSGNGTVTATGNGLPWIIKWVAGVEFYDGADQFTGGPRIFFVAGTQETVPKIGIGEMNLTTEGLQIFLYAVDDMISRK